MHIQRKDMHIQGKDIFFCDRSGIEILMDLIYHLTLKKKGTMAEEYGNQKKNKGGDQRKGTGRKRL